ncbi:hypothetical protein E1281_11170 [Actinomadura sp. KC345]|uniref:hypothetical protein n=1 Tax=Actinomadura sp. KC345 TaxID=2530371 RepID=UPI00104C2C4B|nr:hypothetical protein [Actinomadura sp. KC345]TDC55668.1 hypothetical protein E1281_11170 [Actinomadura sp. KC345]
MSVPPPALTITTGRWAYRWPLRVGLTALTAGLAVSLSTLSGPEAWDPEDARRTVAVYGGGGLVIAFAAALWAFMIHRGRLVVTIGEKGLALRRGTREASIPAGAVDAVGITWPVADPAWTVWFDPEAAPGFGAVAKVEGRTAVLFRDRSLPPGWIDAVRSAATEVLGAPWLVLDEEGEEVGRPPEDALRRAGHIRVDGAGRYRDRDGGVLLAVACGRLAGRPQAGPGSLPLGAGSRTIVLRDPHGRTLLVLRRRAPVPGRDRMRVSDAHGHLVGEIRGGHEPSFHTADGTLLGTTRRTGDRYVVTGVDARESASLQIGDDAGGGALRLERSPSAPDPLRTLALALPMVIRVARRI